MSDARDEYEQAITDLHGQFSSFMDNAHAKLRQECDAAWYRYQVRTGMVPVPAADEAEAEVSNDERQPARGSGAGVPAAGIPGIRDDYTEGSDQGAESEPEA